MLSKCVSLRCSVMCTLCVSVVRACLVMQARVLSRDEELRIVRFEDY